MRLVIIVGRVPELFIQPAATIDLPVYPLQGVTVEGNRADGPLPVMPWEGHVLFVAVNNLIRQPFRLWGNSVVYLSHFSNLSLDATLRQKFFPPLTIA